MTVEVRSQLERTVRAMADAAKLAAINVANFIDKGRQARIEAELDRKEEQLRATVLKLAEALSAEAHEARRRLIRESFMASGDVHDGK